MSVAYQPFAISQFPTGINTYLQPWIRPQDALEPLVNAYTYRGTINKRSGYSQFGNTVPDGNPIMGIMQWVNPSGAQPTLVIATIQNLYYYNAGSYTLATASPTFSGSISNFFNWTNWQASSGATSYLYLTNNVNNITRFTGTTASTITPTVLSGVTITTCLDVKVYKQRLLYIRPTLSTGGAQNQSIYWSAVQDPTSNRVDIAGQGGFLEAPTGDTIISAEFVRDVLVVFFNNSTWIFRYTGNDTAPFRWDKVNDSKKTNAPYGSINYDERCTSVGGTGLIACDGVNVQRYDIPIIDYYETNFSIQYYAQTFGQRYDNLSQAWMLYVSNQGGYGPTGTKFPLVTTGGGSAPGSDSALVYNFLENSWATYQFKIPLTCMGTWFNQTGTTWASLNNNPNNQWQNVDQAWNTYGAQKAGIVLLAGDTTGHIWLMDDPSQTQDYYYSTGVLTKFPIVPDVVTTRLNPLLSLGQKTQFGYIDIYYSVAFVSPATPEQINLKFYINNSDRPAKIFTLTLDGPDNSEYAFKRIYTNLIGEFIQMEIDTTDPLLNENSYFQILGIILWVRPAGRLTGP